MVLKVVAVRRDEGDDAVGGDGWRWSSEEDEADAATGEKEKKFRTRKERRNEMYIDMWPSLLHL